MGIIAETSDWIRSDEDGIPLDKYGPEGILHQAFAEARMGQTDVLAKAV